MIREFRSINIRNCIRCLQNRTSPITASSRGTGTRWYTEQGADGLKTGHTLESGYGLVGSAHRDGQRVVMVLNGMKSMKQRSSESRRLIDLMFREFKLYRFYEKDQPVDRANVWLGTKNKIDLVLEEPLHLVMARSDRRKMKVSGELE